MRQGMRAAVLATLGLGLTAAAVEAQTWRAPDTESGARMAGFGAALAIGDATVLVGEPRNSLRPGLVYVYGRTGSTWSEQAKIQAPDAEMADGFGAALSLEGNTLLITQVREGIPGAVHVYTTANGSAWQHAGEFTADDVTATAGFGSSLAQAGERVVVGSPGAGEAAGAVYVFEQQAGEWTQQARLAPADLQARDLFGASLMLSGSRLFVGAPGRASRAGVVYVFELRDGTWTEAGQFAARGVQGNDLFGSRLAMSGETVFVGSPGAQNYGAVYAFEQNEQGEWSERSRLVAFDGTRGGAFGSAIAVAGNEIWVGAGGFGGSGAVHAFQRDETGFTGVSRLRSEAAVPRSGFGAPIVVRDDVAAVGLMRADGGAGTVAIFERDASGNWQETAIVESEVESLPAVTGGEVKCSEEGMADMFPCGDVELMAFLPIKDIGGGRGTNLNDIWGWTDPETNREYALVGRSDGTSFVDITDAANPKYLGDLPKTEGSPSSSWRDIKVYENHAYIVADNAGDHGVQVFDLTRLRGVTTPQTFTMDAHYDGIASAHNIVINEESGFAYSVGSSSGGESCGGGLHMIDVRDPKNPTFAGCFADPQTGRASTGYSHDAQCVMYAGPDTRYSGREICLGSNETALSIADVTDKQNPKALSRVSYPNVAYAHQGWLTDDHRYFYMNDEGDEANGSVPRTRTLIWDLSDLEDPQFAGEYLGETGAIDHNLYVKGNLVYESNYKSGLRILDISNRESPVEVGFIDTLPMGENDASFAGSWSNYPFFPSGNIVVSSIGEGLFIVKKRNPATVF